MSKGVTAGIRPSLNKYHMLFPLFALASFYFLTVDVLADSHVLSLLGEDAVFPMHIAYLLAQSAGFLLFSPLRARFGNGKHAKTALIAVCALSFLSLWGVTCLTVSWFFRLCVLVNLLLSGMIGACSYYYAAMELHTDPHIGRFVGFSIGAAALLQVLLSAFSLPEWVSPAALSLALIAVLLLSLRRETQMSANCPINIKPSSAEPQKRRLLILLLIVAVISLMGGINDGVLTLMHTQRQLNLYAFPRLFYLVGVIVAGFIADWRNGRYFSISILAVMLLATIGVLFLDSELLLNLNACVYSLFAGFAVMFITVPFLTFAQSSPSPALCAGLGRAVRLPFMATGTVLMEFCLKPLPFIVTVCVFVLLSVSLVLLFWMGGLLTPPKKETSVFPGSLFNKTSMQEFAAAYGLTPREAEVFASLLDNRQTNRGIANDLYISTRVLERYITSLYEKTGAKTRIELIDLYYVRKETPEESNSAAEPIAEQPVMRKRRIIPGARLSAEKTAAAAERYGLTRREAQLLEQVYEGKTNEEIASSLGISENTVKFHLKNLMKKMSVSGRGEIRSILDR